MQKGREVQRKWKKKAEKQNGQIEKKGCKRRKIFQWLGIVELFACNESLQKKKSGYAKYNT